jgi:class 3 adenylate cyclase
MPLNPEELERLTRFATESLESADKKWAAASRELVRNDQQRAASRLLEKASMSTPFPGVLSIEEEQAIVRWFFVLMADMRDSTGHLRSEKPTGSVVENGMHRLYLESSALLPTLANHVRARNGRVTEYLGDGVLAFLEAGDIKKTAGFTAAKDLAFECLAVCNDVVNPLLKSRYTLPPFSIGVGVALGQAMITVVGSGDDARAIAFGEPVYDASKLSKEDNEVAISEEMERRWPSSEGGKMRFKKFTSKSTSYVGFRVLSE